MNFLIYQDIWKQINPYMFPDKRSNNYSSYTDGESALINGYVCMVRSVLAGDFPKQKSLYFKKTKKQLIEIKKDLARVKLYTHFFESTIRTEISEDTLEDLLRYVATYQNSKEARTNSFSCERLSDLYKYSTQLTFPKTLVINYDTLCSAKMGKHWLSYLRYVYHYRDLLSNRPLWMYFDDNMKLSKTHEQQALLFRVMWWATMILVSNTELGPKINQFCTKLDKNLDYSATETQRWHLLNIFYHMGSCIQIYTLSTYLVLRYCEGSTHFWKDIIENITFKQDPNWCVMNENSEKMGGLIIPCLARMLEACLTVGNEEIVAKICDYINLHIYREDSTYDEHLSQQITEIIGKIRMPVHIFDWLKTHEPKLLYGFN